MQNEGLTVVLPAEPDSVGRARRLAEEQAVRWGADPRAASEIALAVSEACTNVVVHAYQNMPVGNLHLTVERRAAQLQLVVSVADEGRGMAPRTDSPGLGLGLPTIAALCSRLEVRPGPRDRGTALRMTFALAAEEGGADVGDRAAVPVDIDVI